jgi:hypothetical protein
MGKFTGHAMNFRRGFFRLWVVLSVLYVAAIGAIFYGDLKAEFALANNVFSQFDTNIPVLCKDARGKQGVDYKIDKGPWNDYRQDKLCWYEEAAFRAQYPEYKDVSDKTLVDRLYALAGVTAPRRAEPWKLLFTTAAIALLVPLAILITGTGIGWAFAGFRTGAPNVR